MCFATLHSHNISLGVNLFKLRVANVLLPSFFFFFLKHFSVSTFTSGLSKASSWFLRVCSGQRGRCGVATRHISRRALIGCRFSPDTAVIVFCRGSSCPWYELVCVCAEEWSSTVCVCVHACDDDVNKQRDCSSKQENKDFFCIIIIILKTRG